MKDRSLLVGNTNKNIDHVVVRNIHRDFTNDALAVMTYINTVGGGTGMFTESNGECKIVERFHSKKNRTVIFPANELHAAIYDLNNWPDNVPYRLTLNMFLIKKHKTIFDRVVWDMQENVLKDVEQVYCNKTYLQ